MLRCRGGFWAWFGWVFHLVVRHGLDLLFGGRFGWCFHEFRGGLEITLALPHHAINSFCLPLPWIQCSIYRGHHATCCFVAHHGDASCTIILRHATWCCVIALGLFLVASCLSFPNFLPISAISIDLFWAKSWRSSHALIWLSLVSMESSQCLLSNKIDLGQFWVLYRKLQLQEAGL